MCKRQEILTVIRQQEDNQIQAFSYISLSLSPSFFLSLSLSLSLYILA